MQWIDTYAEESLSRLYKYDRYLIDHKPSDQKREGKHYVGERSIVFRFALYFYELIMEDPELCKFDLDCEYNRYMSDVKALPSFGNGIYPDVILHKRGKTGSKNNILAFEFKTYWNRNQEDDCKKLLELTDQEGKYGFYCGMAIRINRRDWSIQKFQNGRRV